MPRDLIVVIKAAQTAIAKLQGKLDEARDGFLDSMRRARHA
jgi:hypothetical protein